MVVGEVGEGEQLGRASGKRESAGDLGFGVSA